MTTPQIKEIQNRINKIIEGTLEMFDFQDKRFQYLADLLDKKLILIEENFYKLEELINT